MTRRMHRPVLHLQQHYVAANNGAQVIRQAISAGGGAPKQTWSYNAQGHGSTSIKHATSNHPIVGVWIQTH